MIRAYTRTKRPFLDTIVPTKSFGGKPIFLCFFFFRFHECFSLRSLYARWPEYSLWFSSNWSASVIDYTYSLTYATSSHPRAKSSYWQQFVDTTARACSIFAGFCWYVIHLFPVLIVLHNFHTSSGTRIGGMTSWVEDWINRPRMAMQ